MLSSERLHICISRNTDLYFAPSRYNAIPTTSPPMPLDLDEIIKALAHPVRREILNWLKDPQACFPDQHHSTRRQTRPPRTQARRNHLTRPRKTNDRTRQSRRNSNTKHGTPPKTNTHNRFFLPLRLSLFSSMRPVSRVAIGVWGVPR